MPERRVNVAAPEGLHARPAAVLVKAVTAAGVAVTIARPGSEPVDARSILSVLALDVRQGEEVVLRADGTGADAALDRLAALLAGGPRTGGPRPVGPPEGGVPQGAGDG